jgi:hypothetical protein
MKKIEELTKDECQIFLNEIFDDGVEFSDINESGIEYTVKGNKRLLTFSNPELLILLYENDIDLTKPLEQLRCDYMEMDETNSTLFEYVMEVNGVINNVDPVFESIAMKEVADEWRSDEFRKIRKLQKDLISKL